MSKSTATLFTIGELRRQSGYSLSAKQNMIYPGLHTHHFKKEDAAMFVARVTLEVLD